MSDLLGAAARIDDAARAFDHAFSTPGARLDRAHLAVDRLASDVSLQLGASMPTRFGAEMAALRLPWDDDLVELAKVRASLSELGAVTRAVHELGGVDHVISQGGLDAIDGAADVVRRHLLLDAKDQLRSALPIIDERPFGVSMSRGKRAEHLHQVDRALSAPLHQLERSGLVTDATAILRQADDGGSSASSSRDSYDGALAAARSIVDDVDALSIGDLPAPAEAWTSRMLPSNRARSIATEQAARATLPIAPRLSTLADDASVLANARAALDQHEATFDALLVAVGDARYYDSAYTTALKGALPKLERASEDLVRIEQLVATASDPVRDAAFVARDWVAYAAGEAAAPSGGFYGNQQRALPMALANVRALRDQLAPIADEPELLRASTDAAEEVQEVLARPGARVDLDVLRGLLDGDSAQSAKVALVEHLPSIKPHPVDAPRTGEPREALALLDEAGSIGSALTAMVNKGRWVPEQRLLDEPGLVDATEELLGRADTALGTKALVSEATARSLEANVDSMRDRVRHVTTESWAKPDHYALKSLNEAVQTYRDELSTLAARADADGGLRAISPSARPEQAAEARGRWMLRELDALTAPAADAPSDVHVADAARRATIVHDLLRIAGGTQDRTAAQALVERAMTEYQSLGASWRMPDDVALDLARIRNEIRVSGSLDLSRQLNTSLDGYNTNPGMLRTGRIASGLQAWAMFTDGPLPATTADRLSVAARRGAAIRTHVEQLATKRDDDMRKLRLGDHVADLRVRIADVEAIADGADLSATKAGLDSMFARLEAEVERRAALTAKYEKTDSKAAEVFALREHLDPWIAALEDAHRTARASASEQLSW